MVILCENWSEYNKHRGNCSLGKRDGRPSLGYCVDICKKCTNTRNELTEYLTRPYRKHITVKLKGPTKTQMLLHFAKAMTKWVSKGMPICSKETYIERRTLCTECHDGNSCPVCGCKLWAKAALETEKCPKGKW